MTGGFALLTDAVLQTQELGAKVIRWLPVRAPLVLSKICTGLPPGEAATDRARVGALSCQCGLRNLDANAFATKKRAIPDSRTARKGHPLPRNLASPWQLQPGFAAWNVAHKSLALDIRWPAQRKLFALCRTSHAQPRRLCKTRDAK